MAMVWTLALAIPEHLGGNFDHLAGCADDPGNHRSQCCRRRRAGWNHLDRKWHGTISVGLVLRSDWTPMGFPLDVRDPGDRVLHLAASHELFDVHSVVLHRTALLWRRFRHHARVRR